jgi:hypothetical protein
MKCRHSLNSRQHNNHEKLASALMTKLRIAIRLIDAVDKPMASLNLNIN